MDKEEKEFQKRKAKIAKFKKDLKKLMTKYNFGIHESHNYNGMEEHCSTDYYFVVDSENWYGETISDILNECLWNHNIE